MCILSGLLVLIEEVHPLKQGLKLAINSALAALIMIEEVHPLKQGLKPLSLKPITEFDLIEEVHPLKQGLKHGWDEGSGGLLLD